MEPTVIIKVHYSNIPTVIIKTEHGLQGKAGKDAEFPQNGNTGDVLVKTDSSVAWTNQPTKLNINGGNF